MYLSKHAKILGFVSKPKRVRERKHFWRKPVLIFLNTVQLDDTTNNEWFENYMMINLTFR